MDFEFSLPKSFIPKKVDILAEITSDNVITNDMKKRNLIPTM